MLGEAWLEFFSHGLVTDPAPVPVEVLGDVTQDISPKEVDSSHPGLLPELGSASSLPGGRRQFQTLGGDSRPPLSWHTPVPPANAIKT